MALTAALVGTRGTTGGSSVTTGSGTSAASATFAALVSYDATAGTITTAGDNKGNTYTAVGTAQTDGAGGLLRWYVCENGVGGTGHTFTFTTSGNNFGVAHLVQITSDSGGIPRLDIGGGSAQGQDTVGQPWDTVSTGTLNYANEVILGAVGCNSNGGSTAAYACSNMTMLSSEGNCSSFWTSGVAAANQAGTASFTPSFTKTDAGGATGAGLSHITFREETSGNGNAAGATITVTTSLIGGSAVGDGNATAPGATITVTASLIAGAADVPTAFLYFRAFPKLSGGDAEWSDDSPAAAVLAAETFPPADASGSATAAGATITIGTSVVAGSASAGAAAAGATITVTTSLIGGTAAGNTPTLGAYTFLAQEEANGSTPATTSAITTQTSGSSYLTLRAGYASNNTRPTDSKSNRWRHMGGAVYNGWAGVFDAQVYIAQNGPGGSGHTVTFTKPGNAAGEITIPLVEARNGTRLVDYALVNITAGNALTSGSVTVTGPALLVAVWLGDGGGLSHNATPNNSFANFITYGSLPPNSAVQMFVASREVGSGTYNVTWTETPDQGAILVLAAFGESGPNGYAPEDTITVGTSLIGGSASGASSATAPGATITVGTSVIGGAATAGAAAAGATLTVGTSLIAGSAAGGAVAPGATITVGTSVVAGSASAGAAAPGATLTVGTSLIGGAATAGASAAGATITVTTSLLGGSASAASSGTASGATITVGASLIAGAAAGGATAGGTTITVGTSLIPGAATGAGGATAPGATVSVGCSVLSGTAAGGALAPGAVVAIALAVIAGTATGAGPVTRGRATVTARAIGGASVTATRVGGATASARGTTNLEVDST